MRESAPLLGIVNQNKKWIVHPIFEKIIYITHKDSGVFWCKLRSSQQASSDSRSSDWTLLNRDGEQIVSLLPVSCEPVMEHPPSQATPGTSFYAEAMLITDGRRYGLCDHRGKLILSCNYTRIHDVGSGLYIVERPQIDCNDEISLEFPRRPAKSNDKEQRLDLFDFKGTYIATLPPTGRALPHGHFVDGLLRIGDIIINRSGAVLSSGNKAPPACLSKSYDFQNRNHGLQYRITSSAAQPIEFLPDSADPKYASNYAAPIFVTHNRALVFIKELTGTKTGIVDSAGRWIVQPTSRYLAYCAEDRMISSEVPR